MKESSGESLEERAVPVPFALEQQVRREILDRRLQWDYYAKVFTIARLSKLSREQVQDLIKKSKSPSVTSDGETAINLKTLIPYMRDKTIYQAQALVLFRHYMSIGRNNNGGSSRDFFDQRYLPTGYLTSGYAWRK